LWALRPRGDTEGKTKTGACFKTKAHTIGENDITDNVALIEAEKFRKSARAPGTHSGGRGLDVRNHRTFLEKKRDREGPVREPSSRWKRGKENAERKSAKARRTSVFQRNNTRHCHGQDRRKSLKGNELASAAKQTGLPSVLWGARKLP